MQNGQIIALGSINADMQVRIDRWPDPGETLLGREFRMLGGGKAANVATIARRLGAPVRLIGHVGDDPLADVALSPLQEAGIDLAAVRRVSGQPTAVSLITVRPDGEKAIVLAANANDVWSADDQAAAAEVVRSAPEGSVLVVDFEVPVGVVRRAVEAASDRGFLVVLDPSPADRFPDDLFDGVDFLTPNTSESRRLTGVEIDSDEAAARAGRALLERGLRAVFQKVSGGGCLVVQHDGVSTVRPPRVDVVDTTGAGDAFAGALAVALLERQEILSAARFAVAASTAAVTTYGSQPAYPDRATLDRYLNRLGGE